MLSQLICVQSPIVVASHQHNTTMSRYRAKRTQSFRVNRRQAVEHTSIYYVDTSMLHVHLLYISMCIDM